MFIPARSVSRAASLAGRMAQMDIDSSSSSAAGGGGRKRSSAAVERASTFSKRARTTEPEPSRARAARARTLSASDALQLPGDCPSPQLPKPGRGSDTDDEAAAHSSDEGGDFEGGDALDFARKRALRLSLVPMARGLLARAARPPPPHLAPPAAAGAWAIVPFRPAADPWGCAEAGPGGVAENMDLDPEL